MSLRRSGEPQGVLAVKTAERVEGVADGPARRAGQRLLACDGLFHLYLLEGREVVALQGVDFAVDWCEMVALLGPSGSGKSTMLAILGGLEQPSAGQVVLDGIDVGRLSGQLTMLRRRRLGFVWQGAARNLLPHATALENLDLPMVLAGLPAGLAPAAGQGAAGRGRPGRRGRQADPGPVRGRAAAPGGGGRPGQQPAPAAGRRADQPARPGQRAPGGGAAQGGPRRPRHHRGRGHPRRRGGRGHGPDRHHPRRPDQRRGPRRGRVRGRGADRLAPPRPRPGRSSRPGPRSWSRSRATRWC